MEMASLKDKVIIVTGASCGIGKGIAVHLSRFEPRLVLCSRDIDKLNETSTECQQNGLKKEKVLVRECDVREDKDIDKVIQTTINTFGQIDVLINNAGIGVFQSVQNSEMDAYDNIMRVNVRAPYYFSKSVIPHLKRTKGTIINISSILGQTGLTSAAAYSMSKASLDHLTRLLAAELAEFGIRVNCVSPGFTNSEFSIRAGIPEKAMTKVTNTVASGNPMGRVGEPDDVAKLVQFLLSDDSSYITGEIICVDGGSHITVKHTKTVDKAMDV